MPADPNPGTIIWFIGLSGAGKTTLSTALAAELRSQSRPVKLLDGDEIRKGLCADLGFSMADRMENIRRVACAAALLASCGVEVIVATISPLQQFRDMARAILPEMVEVFVDTPLAICEDRDPKGLYRLARAGSLQGFTGVDSPFEAPTGSEVVCRTDREPLEQSVAKVLTYLQSQR